METASQQHCCLVLGGQAEAGPKLGVGRGLTKVGKRKRSGFEGFGLGGFYLPKGFEIDCE